MSYSKPTCLVVLLLLFVGCQSAPSGLRGRIALPSTKAYRVGDSGSAAPTVEESRNLQDNAPAQESPKTATAGTSPILTTALVPSPAELVHAVATTEGETVIMNEPSEPAAPPREFMSEPFFTAHFTLASGRFDHETRGSNLDDRQPAGFARLQVEGISAEGLGAGISVEGLTSDDDLFESDGFTPQEARMSDIFLYVVFQGSQQGKFRVPLRVGPYFRRLLLEDQANGDEVDWRNFGVRLEIEPEFIIHHSGYHEWTGFLLAGFGYHGSDVDIESTTVTDSFDSEGSTFSFEAGTRIRLAGFSAGLSYIYRGLFVDQTDRENGLFVREIDSTFNGIAVQFGARF